MANLITGSGNDTLIGNDRDNHLTANGGNDILVTNGGNDTVSGGAGTDTIYFGPGRNILRDTLADLNGDVVVEFGFGAVDVLDALLGAPNIAVSPQQATLTAKGSTVLLNGSFTGGEFLVSQRGAGADAHTAMAFVQFLPTLLEGVSVSPTFINGIASQPFLTGDGMAHFTLDFRSAVSAFSNQLGWYKVAADGTIGDVHVLFANTRDSAVVALTINLGVPASDERIGFFLIQNGFRPTALCPTIYPSCCRAPARLPSRSSGSRRSCTALRWGSSRTLRCFTPTPASIPTPRTRSCPALPQPRRSC